MKRLWPLLFLLLGSCSGVFYQPDQVLYSDPTLFHQEFENIYFQSRDSTRLHGWYFPQETKDKRKGIVLFFHGNAQNISGHYVILSWLTKHGYDLFIFDYRGYGLSEGSPHQKGVYLDGLAALDFVEKKLKPHEQLVVYSQSLGGAIAAKVVADYEKKERIDLLVFDSTFPSYRKVAFSKIENNVFIVLTPLLPLLISDEYSPWEDYPDFKMPVLVVHGKQDQVVPHKFGEMIFERLKSKESWFWSLEEGGHIDGFFIEDKKYRKKFIDLLQKLSINQ